MNQLGFCMNKSDFHYICEFLDDEQRMLEGIIMLIL